MSENDMINEITSMMKNNSIDLSGEIASSIHKVFREKYIDKINGAVKSRYEVIQANPTKEIRFLSIMKEFMDESRHDGIDKMINMYTMLNTFNDLKSNVKATYVKAPEVNICACALEKDEESVHEDGIYDIDTNCLIQKEGKRADLLSAMMMMIFMGNGSSV